MKRRQFNLAAVAGVAMCGGVALSNSWAQGLGVNWHERLQQLEAQSQGRLGVCLLNTHDGQTYGHRSGERFLMLSSFKLLASALVLARVDRGEESLDRRVAFGRRALVDWSPVTERHAEGPGLTLGQLCEATLTTSDNTAANLILDSYGGPAALTAFARQLGDTQTRLDRREPELNRPVAGQPWDTTTPAAMAQTLQHLLVGKALSPASRTQLLQWLVANTTGDKRLRAGLPAGWAVGEKTGTNRNDANDIGWVQAPGRAPWLVCAYLADSPVPLPQKEAVLAGVGQLLAALAV